MKDKIKHLFGTDQEWKELRAAIKELNEAITYFLQGMFMFVMFIFRRK